MPERVHLQLLLLEQRYLLLQLLHALFVRDLLLQSLALKLQFALDETLLSLAVAGIANSRFLGTLWLRDGGAR